MCQLKKMELIPCFWGTGGLPYRQDWLNGRICRREQPVHLTVSKPKGCDTTKQQLFGHFLSMSSRSATRDKTFARRLLSGRRVLVNAKGRSNGRFVGDGGGVQRYAIQ
jgi:hypothetical protein